MTLSTTTGPALRRAAAAACLLLCATAAHAQSAPYKFDGGVSLGMSGYIGDANSANIFAKPGFDGELTFRYIGDARWAVRGLFSTFGLKGDTSGMTDVLPDGASYSFTSQVYELSARGEFNFFPYGIGETYKRLRRWTPYIAVGLGCAMASSGGNTSVTPVIPMAFGLKFKLSERWNLGVEFSMTKTFSDHIDGADLADLNRIETAFYKNTDWFSRLTVGITYEFGKRCETCHYVD